MWLNPVGSVVEEALGVMVTLSDLPIPTAP
jgi:hypothetical protein